MGAWPLAANPYPFGSPERQEWLDGYEEGERRVREGTASLARYEHPEMNPRLDACP